MPAWYMVKRLDTGQITGHDMYFHGTLTGEALRKIGTVEEQARDGVVHHLIAYVDAMDERDARFMAEVAFRDHEDETQGKEHDDE